MATFAVLLMIVNWACGSYLKKSSHVNRDELPNYKSDQTYAREVFRDYGRVQHQYESRQTQNYVLHTCSAANSTLQ